MQARRRCMGGLCSAPSARRLTAGAPLPWPTREAPLRTRYGRKPCTSRCECRNGCSADGSYGSPAVACPARPSRKPLPSPHQSRRAEQKRRKPLAQLISQSTTGNIASSPSSPLLSLYSSFHRHRHASFIGGTITDSFLPSFLDLRCKTL